MRPNRDERGDEDKLHHRPDRKSGNRPAEYPQVFSCGAHVCRKQGDEKQREATRRKPCCRGQQESYRAQYFQTAGNAHEGWCIWERQRNHANQISPALTPMRRSCNEKHQVERDPKRKIKTVQRVDTEPAYRSQD